MAERDKYGGHDAMDEIIKRRVMKNRLDKYGMYEDPETGGYERQAENLSKVASRGRAETVVRAKAQIKRYGKAGLFRPSGISLNSLIGAVGTAAQLKQETGALPKRERDKDTRLKKPGPI